MQCNLYSSGVVSLSGNFKHAYVRFLPIFVMLCILTHWNATALPFSTYIDDDDDDDHDDDDDDDDDDDEDEFFLRYG